MIKDISSKILLNNGVEMPWLGLGVLRLNEGGEVENAVRIAIEAGYRLIDNAAIYHNEKGVARGIKANGIPREDLFLSSKIANDQQGYHSTFKAFQRSLEWLQTDYLDLYLIHWPQGELSVETWMAMEELYKKGKIRAIGVSNFWIHHLEYFLPKINVIPAVNQIEFHPRMTQPKLLQFCIEKNIQVEAWSPIMQGQVLKIPEIKEIASKYGKSPAQVVLRWDLQKGVITIPRSAKKKEIIENANIFDFELDEEDIKKIDSLNKNKTVFPYYDKIPFLIKALGIVEQKEYVLRLLVKAIIYKSGERLKRIFTNRQQFVSTTGNQDEVPAEESPVFVKK
jgi:methylglyoxal/glyoxal reductase